MAMTFQVTVDSNDPHALADWWAETLGWKVEEQDPKFIQRMIDEGQASADDAVEYEGSLVWRAGAAIISPDDGVPRVLFQLVPEAKTVKNRLHFDLRGAGDDVAAVRGRLLVRGATFLHEGSVGPTSWVTMADPQGNEFCV